MGRLIGEFDFVGYDFGMASSLTKAIFVIEASPTMKRRVKGQPHAILPVTTRWIIGGR